MERRAYHSTAKSLDVEFDPDLDPLRDNPSFNEILATAMERLGMLVAAVVEGNSRSAYRAEA